MSVSGEGPEPAARRGWRPASLRSGVAWSATLVVTAWLLVLAAVAVLVVGISLGRAADDSLRTRAQAVATTVRVAADGAVTQLEGPDDGALDTNTWIYDGSGALAEGPAPGVAAPEQVADLADRVLAERAEVLVTADADDPVRLLGLPVAAEQGDALGVVVTTTSLVPYRQLQRVTLGAVAVLGVLLVVGVHLVLRVALGRALSPVAQMGGLVERWSTDDPGQRLGDAPRPAELRALAGTLDGLLDRIAAALRHERTLTAELSHELRTPLAGVRAEFDWLRAPERTPAEREAAHGDLDEAVTRLERVLEELLASARSATAAPGRCLVGEVVDRVLAGATPRAGAAGAGGGADGDLGGGPAAGGGVLLRAEVDAGLAVGVEAPVLERALSPLVDNARRWAASDVLVRARRVDGRVHVSVLDDGPGVPAELTARVLEPGFRADPDEAHRGAGLGLALAARLVRTAGGDVLVRPAGPTGGGDITLVLPAG